MLYHYTHHHHHHHQHPHHNQCTMLISMMTKSTRCDVVRRRLSVRRRRAPPPRTSPGQAGRFNADKVEKLEKLCPQGGVSAPFLQLRPAEKTFLAMSGVLSNVRNGPARPSCDNLAQVSFYNSGKPTLEIIFQLLLSPFQRN